MRYKNIERAEFISRPNRFTAVIKSERGIENCHVKNTGRCRELLTPGAQIYIERAEPGALRKTECDLISVVKDGRLINIDSQAPNKAAYEWISAGGLIGEHTLLRREVTYGKSRIDFYAEKKGGRRIFIEVKGVTLFYGTTALFPDAPTERGAKHLAHLSNAVREGFESYVLFVIQASGLKLFMPNSACDPLFAKALRDAFATGVKVHAVGCRVDSSSMEICEDIECDISSHDF